MRIEDIKVIGLFGGGRSNTAQLCIFFAQLKYEVYLCDRIGKLLEKSKENIEILLKKLYFQGKKKQEEIHEIRNRIKITLELAELCKVADIVIDTHRFFNIQQQHLLIINYFCKPDTIFTLNFSDNVLFERIPELPTPRKIIGLYFFFPFLTSKRVNLIKTSATPNESVKFLYNFLKSLGIKIKFYKTNLLKSTISLKINKFLNQILWFRNQIIKRTSQGKISFIKNLRRMAKYYYVIYQKIIGSLKSPIRNLKLKLYAFKLRLNKFIYKKKDNKNLMINLGGGTDYRKHWRILDYHSNWFRYESLFIDYFFDLGKNEPFPFKDNSVKFFYSSGCFEHLIPEAVQNNFNEIYRCLNPGGAARITLPDFDLAYEAYGKKDVKFFQVVLIGDRKRVRYTPNIEALFINFFASYVAFDKKILNDVKKNYETMKKEDFANYYIGLIPRDWQENIVGAHSNWFNYEKIVNMIRSAGFKTIYRSDYQKSKFPEMRGGKGSHRFDISDQGKAVYVEAVK